MCVCVVSGHVCVYVCMRAHVCVCVCVCVCAHVCKSDRGRCQALLKLFTALNWKV